MIYQFKVDDRNWTHYFKIYFQIIQYTYQSKYLVYIVM